MLSLKRVLLLQRMPGVWASDPTPLAKCSQPLLTRLAAIVRSANVAVVRCRGRLIYGQEAAELDHTLRRLLETTKQIVLQMGDVIQIDSGVGALGAAFMVAHNREGVVKLANLTPRVEEVLRITGLALLFDVHGSEIEAVEAFSKSSTAAVTTSL